MSQENKTEVIFRQYKNSDDIVAIFPFLAGTSNYDSTVYERVGQHGAGNYRTVIEITNKPTNLEGVENLRKELKNIGYNLREIKKISSYEQLYNKLFEDFRSMK